MKISKITKDKIDRINTAINEGMSLATMKRELFGGHSKKCINYLEKHSDYILNLEALIYPKNEVVLKKNESIVPIDRKIMSDLMELLEYKENLIELASGKKKIIEDIDDVLTIPNEYIKMNNLQMKTYRIDKKLTEEFDKVCKKYSVYTKTSIMNYMISQFIERFKN